MRTFCSATALVLGALGSSAILVASQVPTAAQPGTNVNGWNVVYVRMPGGHYSKQADGTWAEFDANGRVTFRFIEAQRDEWSVYLNDPSRNVQIQLDLFRRKISYGTNGEQRSDLYDITGSSSSGAPVAVAPPPPPPQRTRLVNAGPIWNQGDAQMKCPVVAYAVNGRWTGGWRTTQEGRMSVCEIAD